MKELNADEFKWDMGKLLHIYELIDDYFKCAIIYECDKNIRIYYSASLPPKKWKPETGKYYFFSNDRNSLTHKPAKFSHMVGDYFIDTCGYQWVHCTPINIDEVGR